MTRRSRAWSALLVQRGRQGQGRQGQELCQRGQHPQTRHQGPSEEEAELVGCGKSGAIVRGSLWCDWRDDVQRLLPECVRGGGRAEQLRVQDGPQRCSEIGGSCRRDPRLPAEGREDLLQVAAPRVGARDQEHPESRNRGDLTNMQGRMWKLCPVDEPRATCRTGVGGGQVWPDAGEVTRT